MSLYQMVHGTFPLAGELLGMLGLTPDEFGRFRDAFLRHEPDGSQVVVVHARIGGGNRARHTEVFARMRTHPGYVRDYDDEYDPTFADLLFRVPDEFTEVLAAIPDMPSSRERWEAAIERMKGMTREEFEQSPMAELGNQIKKAIDNPGGKVIIV